MGRKKKIAPLDKTGIVPANAGNSFTTGSSVYIGGQGGSAGGSAIGTSGLITIWDNSQGHVSTPTGTGWTYNFPSLIDVIEGERYIINNMEEYNKIQKHLKKKLKELLKKEDAVGKSLFKT